MPGRRLAVVRPLRRECSIAGRPMVVATLDARWIQRLSEFLWDWFGLRLTRSLQDSRMTAYGTSFPFPLAGGCRLTEQTPAVQSSGGNGSKCPIADARLAKSECLLVGVKLSDQA